MIWHNVPEALPLDKCLNYLGEEKADVSLLVFTDGRSSTSHHQTHTDAGLEFCQQRLPVHAIGRQIDGIGLGQPTELEISSETFTSASGSQAAYRIMFHHFKEDKLYQQFISRIMPKKA